MAITASAYGPFLAALGQGNINFGSDNIWCAIFKADYTPDFDHDSDYFNLRGDYEIADAGGGTELDTSGFYSWNGQQLKNVSWGYDETRKAAVLTASNVVWSFLNGNYQYAIIYKWVPQSIDNIMIGCIDYGEEQIALGQHVEIDLTGGVVTVAR